jgi:hypothetical protein
MYHNTLNGQAPYLAYPTVNTTPPTAFNLTTGTTHTTADSFEKQQPAPANQTELDKDKDKQKDSWVLPLLLVGGLLTLGIGVIALQDPETRTKVMNLLPFLKKEGEEGLGSSNTHTHPPSSPPPPANTVSNITPLNPPPPPPPIVKLPPVVITNEATVLQAEMIEALDIHPNTPRALTRVTAVPTPAVIALVEQTVVKQNNIPAILQTLTTNEDAIDKVWQLVVIDITDSGHIHSPLSELNKQKNLSTQDLVILQMRILNSLKNPKSVFKCASQRQINDKLAWFNKFIHEELRSKGKGYINKGLNPQENQLALAYLHYNRALISIATEQKEWSTLQAFTRCKKALDKVEYTVKGSDGEFLHNLVKDYLGKYADITDPQTLSVNLPTKAEVLKNGGLLLPPTFNSELAHGHVSQAKALLAGATGNKQTLHANVTEMLTPAQDYYFNYIKEQSDHWFGYMGLAQTLYTKAQAELLVGNNQNAEKILQIATEFLTRAKTVEDEQVKRLQNATALYELGTRIPKDTNDRRIDDILRWDIEKLQNQHNLSKKALPPSP